MTGFSFTHVLLVTLFIAGCSVRAMIPAPDLSLVDATVIDVSTGTVARGQTIHISEGKITYVGGPLSARTPEPAEIHYLNGSYVIPGLWDMHVHFRGGPELEDENADWLRQYLGFGVTSVRDAGGDLPDAVLQWRDEIRQGRREGPRIYTSVRKLDGPAAGWPGSISVAATSDISPALDELTQQGADFIKLYDSTISAPLYIAIIQEAKKRGLRTSGHLPVSVAFEEAIRAGLDSVEHWFYLVKGASADDRRLSTEAAEAVARGEVPAFWNTLAELVATADVATLNSTLDEMAARNVALTPTLYVIQVANALTDPERFLSDPQLAEVPPGIRASFAARVERARQRSPASAASQAQVTGPVTRRFVVAAAECGVTILAGSDTGAENSYLYPGDSLHAELAELVEVGLTPLQALQSATLNAAQWLGKGAEWASVTVGAQADLLILSGNPLEDINHTRSIIAVTAQGRFLDAEALAALRRLP